MVEIVRGDALYRQLANVLRTAIENGDYPVGGLLPSEPTLSETYGLSRPTVRLALNTLRAEGLIGVRMGKGSFVRTRSDADIVTVERTQAADRLTVTGQLSHFRQDADPAVADLLNIRDGSATFVQDATAVQGGTGHKVLARTIISFATVEGTPLETEPFPERSALLAALTAVHGKLSATEYVRARSPQADEPSTLALADGAPVLETTRVTSAKGRPLFADIERTSAEGVQYAYKLR
jgi:GntR family transcriptional regulator